MSLLDSLIGFVSPRAAYERRAWRHALDLLGGAGERGYVAAERGRRNADWRVTHGSGDAELVNDLAMLRARSRQLVRDNGYVAAALRNLTANIVGTGIELRCSHEDGELAKRAKGLFDTWALEPVDVEGRHDFYGEQKLAVRSMIEGGETLIGWAPAANGPDGEIQLLEGDQIDGTRNQQLEDGGQVVAGVEYSKAGKRRAIYLWDHHPGSHMAYLGLSSRRHDIRDYDHMFEAVRISGQARGVPWFHAGLSPVREIDSLEESIRIKKRVEACLSVFRKVGEAGTPSPFAERQAQPSGPDWETLRPGMVVTGAPGEEIQVINPSSSGDGDMFMRSQLMKVATSFGLPYHLLTGDVSQANYSSLRASMVAFWALLDDWVFNTVVPQMCNTSFRRRMRVEALRQRNPRLLEVRAEWTPPKRSWVDPLKDITAEALEVRNFGGLPQALASRGRDYREALAEIAQVNSLIDTLGIALDSDPRRVNRSGALQPATGYLRPVGDVAEQPDA